MEIKGNKLDVEGPDGAGDYEFTVLVDGWPSTFYLTRKQADRLLLLLQSPQPQIPILEE